MQASDAPSAPAPPDAVPAAASGSALQPAGRQLRRLERRKARTKPQAGVDPYEASLAKGIDGEQMVGAELERRLSGTGAVVTHSLCFLWWGDIDHLIVGPGGITVVDAKNWAGEVTVRKGVPRVGGWNKARELDKLAGQCAGVRLALLQARPGLRNTGVRGVMCLAAEPYRAPAPLSQAFTLCGVTAAADIGAREGPLGPEDIAHLRTLLLRELPRVRRADIDALLRPSGGTVSTQTANATVRATGSGSGSGARARQRKSAYRRPRPPRRSRRASGKRQLIGALGALGAAVMVAIALPHLRLVVPTVKPAVSGLRLARVGGREIVSLSAPAGSRVRLSVVSDGHRHTAKVVTDGVEQRWHVPARWAHARRLVVEACVVGAVGQCLSGRAVATSVGSRSGRSVVG